MSIKEILLGGGGVLFVLMTLVQIAPIKIDPWTWVRKLPGRMMKTVGKSLNGEVLEKMTQFEEKVDSLEKKVDAVDGKVDDVIQDAEEQKAVNARTKILRFGDEVLHGYRHTKDHFDQILRDIKHYDDYCKTHPKFENNVTEITAEKIKAAYSSCLDNNNFL